MAAGLYDITNEILGKGHFAVVKLAKHCLTGEHVAIKIIDKAKLYKESLDQLSHEIRLWSILSEHEHPNVVKLYQCIDTRTKLYLVMEYCGGQVCDLYDHIQKKNDGNGLDEFEAKTIFRQVCNAILYCHSLKIAHRDLKPENILIISRNNQNHNNTKSSSQIYPAVKLIDFGFSNQWSDNELFRTSCGSLAYSAPEILLGNHYHGPKVDIWALGCILYIMLYGCNPFMQFNDSETLIKILDCSFTTPEKSSVSGSSIDLINGLLKKEPETRLSIEAIMKHPWLEASSEPTLLSGQAVGGNIQHVHDHIIDQMINQGIALPKDTIKKILKNEHSAAASPSPQHAKTAAAVDEVEKSSQVNDHHYIKATYQLLKDKSLRECKGLDQNYNHNNYNKRGNILKKSNFGNLKRLNQSQDRSNNLSLKANPRLQKPNLVNLEVPQNANSFALPLARKCSIVSEEGSVVAEMSLPDPTPAEQLAEQPEDNTHPSAVNIFVTDSSADNQSKAARTSITESISEFSLSQSDASRYVQAKLGDKLGHEPGILHPVSSSPDFLNSATLQQDDEEDSLQEKMCNLSDMRSNEFNSKDNFDISSFNKDTLFTRYRDFSKMKGKKLSNVRVAKSSASKHSMMNPQSGKSPSVRVIIQSKSLNNIALAEQSSEAKLATSMSSVSIKPPKSDKTDCCSIS